MSSGLPAELERVAESMRRHRLDFLLLASPSNVTYVGGFEAPIPVGFVADVTGWLPAVALVSSDGSGSLLLNDADAGGARARSWWPDVRTFETLGQTEAADPRESFSHALTAALQATGLTGRKAVVGVEPTLPRVAAEVLAAECPQAELRDATDAIEDARRTKTPREIELLRRAVAVADEGQRRLLELAAGASGPTSDIGLWSEATGAMERLVGRMLSVSGALVTGAATADWTSPGPVGRPVVPGDPVLLDIGPRVDGYWADCANTVVFGAEPTAEQRRYIEASREACLAGIAALRPGLTCTAAYEAVRDTLELRGIPMSHYAGHEIGVSVNERPRLVPYDGTAIEAGMVFALEAGAYAGPDGVVGARAEKVVLVTEGAPEILSTFPWEV